jgi:hypothetical protein
VSAEGRGFSNCHSGEPKVAYIIRFMRVSRRPSISFPVLFILSVSGGFACRICAKERANQRTKTPFEEY